MNINEYEHGVSTDWGERGQRLNARGLHCPGRRPAGQPILGRAVAWAGTGGDVGLQGGAAVSAGERPTVGREGRSKARQAAGGPAVACQAAAAEGASAGADAGQGRPRRREAGNESQEGNSF